MSPARGIRVIAGSARGRRLIVPAGDAVRPTQDRVREAVFSALDARGAVRDASVLDLYAGTGALAIEALSRGAASAVLVERGRAALDAIDANLSTVGFDTRARVERVDVARYLSSAPSPRFDLVLCDPPYDVSGEELDGVLTLVVPWVTDDAVVVVERAQRAIVHAPAGLRVAWERGFGDTLVTFLQPNAGA